MSVKDWSFFSKKEQGKEQVQEIKKNILDTISLWTAIGLLWSSFVSIIGGKFPAFLESELEKVTPDWGIIFVFVFALWIAYDWPKKYLKKISGICLLVGAGIPIGYFLIKFDEIIDGFYAMAYMFLPLYNSYYKTNLYLQAPDDLANAVTAFTFCGFNKLLSLTLKATL